MSYQDHSLRFRPEPQRPIRYTTHRSIFARMRPLLVGLALIAVVALLVMGATTLIVRLEVSQAQLDSAHLAGMVAGQAMCGGR